MLLYASQSLSNSVSSMMTFLDVATMDDIVVVVFHVLDTLHSFEIMQASDSHCKHL